MCRRRDYLGAEQESVHLIIAILRSDSGVFVTEAAGVLTNSSD